MLRTVLTRTSGLEEQLIDALYPQKISIKDSYGKKTQSLDLKILFEFKCSRMQVKSERI